MYLASMDVPDADAVALLGSTSKVLKISQEQAFEAFGNYWSTVYAPTLYPNYFARAKGARDFLLNMHSVHETVTRTVPTVPVSGTVMVLVMPVASLSGIAVAGVAV